MKISDDNLKVVLYIVGAIILFFMLKYTITAFKKGVSDIFDNPFESDQEKKEKEAENAREYNKVSEAKKQAEQSALKEFPSFKNSSMVDLADKLYRSKKPWYEGNDIKAFNYVINGMRNQTDFLRLVQFFGVRDGLSLRPWIAKNFDASYFNEWMRKNRPHVQFFV